MHGDITALYYMLYCTLSQGLLLVRVSLMLVVVVWSQG